MEIENPEELKVEPWKESTKIQIKLATTSNKNEQQDAKNNVELSTKWTKTPWKTSEEPIIRDRNRSIKA